MILRSVIKIVATSFALDLDFRIYIKSIPEPKQIFHSRVEWLVVIIFASDGSVYAFGISIYI